jgi:purine-binding chemotaxis protein CheW
MSETRERTGVQTVTAFDETVEGGKHLLFRLGDDTYGIAIADVTSIVEMQKITAVPDMPPQVKGVINLRGKVIPVVDLRIQFAMEEHEYGDRTCIIIVEVDGMDLGLIVDTVAEVQSISVEDISPPPRFRSETGAGRFVSGIGRIGDEVRILIDVGRLLREGDLGDVEKIAGTKESE